MRRIVRTAASVLTVVVACALLAGCSGDDEPRTSSDTGGPIEAGARYVALGDSYTSAPYVGKSLDPAGCLRTDANYPHLLAEAADLELTDVSCGGATTADLTKPQILAGTKQTVPAQLDAVSSDTDLVTLSMGGNNGRAFGALVSTCVALGQRDPKGAPCTKFAKDDPGAYDRLYDQITTAISDAVDEIADRAPGARVIVVGYPGIVPAAGTCDRLPLAAGDYPLARQLVTGLVDAQKSAAAERDVEFIDMRPATEGHDICSDDPWIAGITVASGRTGAPYHPYREEQQAVADVLAKVIAKPRP